MRSLKGILRKGSEEKRLREVFVVRFFEIGI